MPADLQTLIGPRFCSGKPLSAWPGQSSATHPCPLHTVNPRVGELPGQKEGDVLDMRSILHRDGSVISSLSLEDLRTPE